MKTYCGETGQVYVETTLPAQSMVTSCMNHFTGRREDPKNYLTRRGAAKLCDMALRTCAWNIYDRGMPETLPCFTDEFKVMRRIYLHLKETDTLTFKAWKLFHVAFPNDFKDDCRVSILKQYGGLDKIDTIYSHICSLASTTLTFLCIQNLTLSPINLKTDILRFSNLGVFFLQNAARRPYSESEDRMIKNWGLSVKSTGAFQKLRVLTLSHFDISVYETLDGLANFPALKLCRLEFAHVPSGLTDAWNSGGRWVHPKGTWRQRLIDSDRQSNRNPETIFGRVDLTTHTKMEMLHNVSAWNDEAKNMELVHVPIVSVHYGNTTSTVSGSTHIAWFVKISLNSKDTLPKHDIEQKSGNKNCTSKRRKMRDGKGMDIGFMLGSFTG